jgi:hypothetical protein
MAYWSRPCGATSKRTGQPCGQWAIKGGTVCWHHGGASKRVREAAARNYAEWQAALPRMRRYLARMDATDREREAARAAR